jgi:hypothetical protein
MVQVLGLEPVAMPSAGEYRRYTKLRKPFDLLADEFVVPLTEDGDASDTADRPAFVALVQPCSFQGVTMLTVIAIAIAILAATGSRVQAQTDLTAYPDAMDT